MEVNSQLFATVLGRLNLLILAMMTRRPVLVFDQVGIVNQVEVEDGSGYRYNITLYTEKYGTMKMFVNLSKTNIFFHNK